MSLGLALLVLLQAAPPKPARARRVTLAQQQVGQRDEDPY